MPRLLRKFAVVVAMTIVSIHGLARGQAILKPPFGLHWGDSPEHLLVWAGQNKLDVNILIPGNQPDMKIVRITAQSGKLPDSEATSMEGRFMLGQLFEISVHFADPDASSDTIESRFEELKKQITLEYGKLHTNQQQRSVKDQFITRTESFHREPVKGLFLLLAISEVEDLLRKSKQARFSLIYRNDNFRQQLEESLKSR